MAEETAVAEPKRRGRPPKYPVHEPEEQLTAEQWMAQPACPSCHARPGRHPDTGIWVRSWDMATRKWIEGHRASCLTLAKKP